MQENYDVSKPATALPLSEVPLTPTQPRPSAPQPYIHLTTWNDPQQILRQPVANPANDPIDQCEAQRIRRELTLLDRLYRAYNAFMRAPHAPHHTLRRTHHA